MLRIDKLLKKIIYYLIRFYQIFLSPFLGKNCRFSPTCSEYCLLCFEKFPFWQALWYSFKRTIRCNPFCRGGDDPIPNKK